MRVFLDANILLSLANPNSHTRLLVDLLLAYQRKAVTDKFEASKKTSDAAIKELLNNDADFAALTHWEDTEPERMQMKPGC